MRLADLTGTDEPVALDGGLATELEAAGHDLSDDLWSARLLRDDPAAIEDVHLAYFRAGARVAITASYQASYEGFARAGIAPEEATVLLRRSVELARAARERRVAELEAAGEAVPRLLVAASIGPYGAMLADGQEYEGNYGLARQELAAFHRPRIAALLAAGPDLLAFETIPSQLEAEALVGRARRAPGRRRPGSRTRAGTAPTPARASRIEEAVAVAERSPQVVAVGLNCTRPEHVDELLARAASATRLPARDLSERWAGLGRAQPLLARRRCRGLRPARRSRAGDRWARG